MNETTYNRTKWKLGVYQSIFKADLLDRVGRKTSFILVTEKNKNSTIIFQFNQRLISKEVKKYGQEFNAK